MPAPSSASASTRLGHSGANATLPGWPVQYDVIVVSVGSGGAGPRSKPSNAGSASAPHTCRARSGRKLQNTSSSPARISPRGSMIAGSTNSSVTPAVVGGRDGRRGAVRAAARPRPRRRGSTAPCAPSGGRDPSRDAAADGREPRRAVGPLRLQRRQQPGRLVRRDVAAVGDRVHVRDHALPRAPARPAPAGGRRASARRRRRRGPSGAAACRRRGRGARRPPAPGCRRSVPSATASDRRTRSWCRCRPAPIVRWPTSELPIWPSGRPTARPDAASVVCGKRAQRSSNTGVARQVDGVARARAVRGRTRPG